MTGLERNRIGVLGVLLVAALAVIAGRVFWDPDGRILPPGTNGEWIAVDEPVTAEIRQWRQRSVPVVQFETSFDAGPAGGAAEIVFRSFGEATIRLNGEPVFGGEDARGAAADWKHEVRREVSAGVQSGRNRLVVEVRNDRGPGLLSLALRGPGFDVASGPDWMARRGHGPHRRAIVADDTRPHLSAHRAERAVPALAERTGALAALFLAGAAGFLLWNRRARTQEQTGFAGVAIVSVGAVWVALFAVSFREVPVLAGFDAGSHLDYIRRLANGSGLPIASDGFAMYHPPLFYALAAAAGKITEAVGLSSALGWKLIPFASGLGLTGLGWLLARRIVPERPGLWTASLVFSGLLPMNLVIAAYIGNEGLHAVVSAAALVVAVDILLRERLSLGRLMVFSILVGLALLAKFTALLVAGVAGGALALRIAISGRGAAPSRVQGFAALLLPAVAVAGWFYSRSFVLYGTAVFGNWELSEPGQVWWVQPGFHTAAYYFEFGSSLTRPFLAGFESFWDALYSTVWGDGFFAGSGGPGARHGVWDYGWMATGYLLALPATCLGVLGYFRGAILALRDSEPRRRAVWAVLGVLSAATLFAIFWMTLSLPYFGQAKAFYGLFLTPVLGIYLAMGFESFDRFLSERGGAVAQAVLYGWAVVFFGVIFLSFLG